MSIVQALADIGKELSAVGMRNMQRYKARHIYDVYNKIQPLLAKHNVVITRRLIDEKIEPVESKNGTKGFHRFQRWEFTFNKPVESGIDKLTTEWTTESIDFGDKSASQCDAMAFKQMLIHTFLIPTETMQDPDDAPQKQVTDEPKVNENADITIKHIEQIKKLADYAGWSNQDVKDHIKDKFKKDSAKNLTMGEYVELCKDIQASSSDGNN